MRGLLNDVLNKLSEEADALEALLAATAPGGLTNEKNNDSVTKEKVKKATKAPVIRSTKVSKKKLIMHEEMVVPGTSLTETWQKINGIGMYNFAVTTQE